MPNVDPDTTNNVKSPSCNYSKNDLNNIEQLPKCYTNKNERSDSERQKYLNTRSQLIKNSLDFMKDKEHLKVADFKLWVKKFPFIRTYFR